jgi:hypothetical protein
VAQAHSISSAGALHRAVMHRKDHAISLTEQHDFSPRLHPWLLFHQHELTTGQVLTWSREEKRNLQRKDEITINVLVKTIEIAYIVLQQKRSGPNLSLTVALFQKGRMRRGYRTLIFKD